MKTTKPFSNKALLWWVATISLIISGLVYTLLRDQVSLDPTMAKTQMVFPLMGVIIAGVCLIAGTAERWFK